MSNEEIVIRIKAGTDPAENMLAAASFPYTGPVKAV